jgi:hypothetical protein
MLQVVCGVTRGLSSARTKNSFPVGSSGDPWISSETRPSCSGPVPPEQRFWLLQDIQALVGQAALNHPLLILGACRAGMWPLAGSAGSALDVAWPPQILRCGRQARCVCSSRARRPLTGWPRSRAWVLPASCAILFANGMPPVFVAQRLRCVRRLA